jgi:hypothetical protein
VHISRGTGGLHRRYSTSAAATCWLSVLRDPGRIADNDPRTVSVMLCSAVPSNDALPTASDGSLVGKFHQITAGHAKQWLL